MSAKNRGTVGIAQEDYPTPPWVVHRLLDDLRDQGFWDPPRHPLGRSWLESAVGKGHIVDAVTSWGRNVRWYTSGNYLTTPLHGHRFFYVGITNPPFSLTVPFIEKMRLECRHTFILQRLNFLANPYCQISVPDVYVLPNRPTFAHKVKCSKSCKGVMVAWDAPTPREIRCTCFPEQGGRLPLYRTASADATEYAWFHWTDVPSQDEGLVRMLALTTVEERRVGDGRWKESRE